MILTGSAIKEAIESGDIKIEGYKEENVNPNSYDLTLAPTLKVYVEPIIDVRRPNATIDIKMNNDGYILQPGQLYLAHTNERTSSPGLVPKLYGKSSMGRLGLNATNGAGYGDTGFEGQWTLAITVLKPLKIYPNMKIVQIEFSEVVGEVSQYSGKYQNSQGAEASKSFKDS